MACFRALVGFGIIVTAWAACHYTDKHTDNSDDFCIHPEYPNLKIKTGSNFMTPNCHNITCLESNIVVCEYGWRLAKMVVLPSECKKIRIGDCGVKFVKVADESMLCFTNE